jgi:hypothetical protein
VQKEHQVKKDRSLQTYLSLNNGSIRAGKKPDEAIKNREDARKHSTVTVPVSREKLPPRAKDSSVSETASGT